MRVRGRSGRPSGCWLLSHGGDEDGYRDVCELPASSASQVVARACWWMTVAGAGAQAGASACVC